MQTVLPFVEDAIAPRDAILPTGRSGRRPKPVSRHVLISVVAKFALAPNAKVV